MIYFTTFEIIRSIIAAGSLGLFFGCFFSAAENTLASLKLLFALPYESYRLSKNYALLKEKRIAPRKKSPLTKIARNVFEFFFFLLFGIAYIALVYVFLDGVFRIYFTLITIFTFFVGKRFLGAPFCKIYDLLFRGIYLVLMISLSFIYIPLSFIFGIIKSIALLAFSPLEKRYRIIYSKYLINKKIKEISRIKL